MEEWQDSLRCSWARSHPGPGISLHLFLVLCTVGRKQFMRFEWANRAAEALGCDYEELNSATFKHHLRQILEQMTSGPQRQGLEDNEACSGTKQSRPHSLQRLCWWLRYMLSVSSRVHQDSLGELLCALVPGWGMPVLGEKETVPP